jgi:hypothetical protein
MEKPTGTTPRLPAPQRATAPAAPPQRIKPYPTPPHLRRCAALISFIASRTLVAGSTSVTSTWGGGGDSGAPAGVRTPGRHGHLPRHPATALRPRPRPPAPAPAGLWAGGTRARRGARRQAWASTDEMCKRAPRLHPPPCKAAAQTPTLKAERAHGGLQLLLDVLCDLILGLGGGRGAVRGREGYGWSGRAPAAAGVHGRARARPQRSAAPAASAALPAGAEAAHSYQEHWGRRVGGRGDRREGGSRAGAQGVSRLPAGGGVGARGGEAAGGRAHGANSLLPHGPHGPCAGQGLTVVQQDLGDAGAHDVKHVRLDLAAVVGQPVEGLGGMAVGWVGW